MIFIVGKSTFINYITNYFRKGMLADIKVAIPMKYRPIPTENFAHSENDIDNFEMSKTTACNPYLFTDSATNKQYLFLDTPGMGDTRGVEQDEKNMQCILEAVESLGGLSAVIIIINGVATRMTSSITNVIKKMRNNLPDAVLDTVIVALTNCKKHTAGFDIKFLDLGAGKIHPFYFQNSAFSADPSKWDEHVLRCLQFDWDDSMGELGRMLRLINECAPKAITAFTDMNK
jgi:hypothetical protein